MNIIEQLRECAKYHFEDIDSKMLREAADEIERLRTTLELIVRKTEHYLNPTISDVNRIATTALEKNDG